MVVSLVHVNYGGGGEAGAGFRRIAEESGDKSVRPRDLTSSGVTSSETREVAPSYAARHLSVSGWEDPAKITMGGTTGILKRKVCAGS